MHIYAHHDGWCGIIKLSMPIMLQSSSISFQFIEINVDFCAPAREPFNVSSGCEIFSIIGIASHMSVFLCLLQILECLFASFRDFFFLGVKSYSHTQKKSFWINTQGEWMVKCWCSRSELWNFHNNRFVVDYSEDSQHWSYVGLTKLSCECVMKNSKFAQQSWIVLKRKMNIQAFEEPHFKFHSIHTTQRFLIQTNKCEDLLTSNGQNFMQIIWDFLEFIILNHSDKHLLSDVVNLRIIFIFLILFNKSSCWEAHL